MAITLTELAILLTGDKSQLNKDLASAEKDTRGWASGLGGTVGKLVGGTIVTGVGTATAAIVGIGAAALNVSNDTRNAAADIEAFLGVTTAEAERLADVAKRVYGNNFADSVGDAADAVALINQQLRIAADDPALQTIAEKAIALRDTFGTEVSESVDATRVLMEEMGLTADQAFDFIAAGQQRGLDRSGDFLDTIREYGNQFNAAGFDAGRFFSILETGSQGGVLGTDKIADAVKEMTIRLNEGGDEVKEGFGAIGLNFDEIAARVASGDANWADYFDNIVNGLTFIDDPIKRSQAQIAIFGTQAEDLGPAFTEFLDTAAISMEDMEGAADSLQKRYSTFGDFFSGLWRRAAVAVSPATDKLLGMANDALPHTEAGFKVFEDNVLPVLNQVGATVQQVASWLSGLFSGNDFQNNVLGNLDVLNLFSDWFDENLPLIRQTADTILSASTGFWDEHGAAIMTIVDNTFGTISTIIDTVLNTILDTVTLVMQLINGDFEGAGETLQGIVERIWGTIKAIVSNQLDNLLTLVTEFGPQVIDFFSRMWASVTETFSNIDWRDLGHRVMTDVLNGLSSLIDNVIDLVSNLVGDMSDEFTDFDWKQAGKEVVSGIVRGINNGIFEVINAVTDLAEGMYDAFRDWWRSRSPSQVAETDLALPIIQGIARGFLNGAGLVKSAIDDFALIIFDGLTQRLNFTDRLGGIFEDTIRSLGDLGIISPVNLVESVLGGRGAVAQAIAEFQKLGTVTTDTLSKIQEAAGPAAGKLTELLFSFLGFEGAQGAVAEAQRVFNDLVAQQEAEIAPLLDQLNEIERQQDALNLERRRARLEETIRGNREDDINAQLAQIEKSIELGGFNEGTLERRARLLEELRALEVERQSATDRESELAKLELEALTLQEQVDLVEERHAAERARAQAQIDAAQEQVTLAEDVLEQQRAIVNEYLKQNDLLSEQADLLNSAAGAGGLLDLSALTRFSEKLEALTDAVNGVVLGDTTLSLTQVFSTGDAGDSGGTARAASDGTMQALRQAGLIV